MFLSGNDADCVWRATGLEEASVTCSTETKQCVRCLRRVEFVYKLSFSRRAACRYPIRLVVRCGRSVAQNSCVFQHQQQQQLLLSASLASSPRPASSVGLRRRSGQKDVLPIGPRASRSAGCPGRPVTVAPAGAINHGWLSASSCDAAALLPLRRCLFINRSPSVSPILDLHCLWPALPCRR